ncbi:DUF6036 family nucleotidyltransferase [Cellulomonas carbonis]|uniref:Nucleotidyl transferase n=1 Tax=Cellulomonas carbonis T26 TaxID=947969 RepID=A0A0A0BS90_9CELL|nr:DUF6036 family nucleotidyltransferase [Cellulomonas carbonis]KGM11303.1 nucleotidyl transferase [Cellulomonas carbonis T26]GGC00878.1 hypothetical protein GCM10010972_12100 [Cellulomonas carbonis]
MAPSARDQLTREEILGLLTELGARLSARGVAATVYVVGGAAMALEFDTRRSTRDIDAVLRPEATVAEEARRMAGDLGLSPGWLSSAATAFVPGGDDDPVPVDVPGLAVAAASPRHLLAMKLAAGRPQDLADLRVLFRHLGIRGAREAADMAFDVYGEHSSVLGESREDIELLAQAVLDMSHA